VLVVLLEERNRELVVEAAAAAVAAVEVVAASGPIGATVECMLVTLELLCMVPGLQHSTDLQQEISMQGFNIRLCSNLY
jgi:phosphopantetheine adenylyltransferase